jgi:hypothetical protein
MGNHISSLELLVDEGQDGRALRLIRITFLCIVAWLEVAVVAGGRFHPAGELIKGH